jgi:hypothetical protein
MGRYMECPRGGEGARCQSLLTDSTLIIIQATLLLPLESGGHTDLTPDFVRDHVALCESPSGDNIPLVTLSGLRGVLVG